MSNKIERHRNDKTSELHKIKVECGLCDGYGEIDVEGDAKPLICPDCGGNGLSRFYYNAIKNVDNLETKNRRTRDLKDFARYLGLTNLEELSTFYKVNGVPDYLIFEKRIGDEYITNELRDNRKLNYKSQKGRIGNIEVAYQLNREIGIPWKAIKEEYIRQPSGIKKPKHHPYTPDDVKKLYDNSETKYKAIITLLLLMRVGGIYERIIPDDKIRYPERVHFLKIRDLRPAMEGWSYDHERDFGLAIPDYSDVYKIVVYADAVNARTGQSEEYITYTTPEGFSLINLQLEQRQKAGELGKDLRNQPFELSNFPPDTPVFRNRYGSTHARGKQEKERVLSLLHPEPLDDRAIRSYFALRRIKHLGHIPKTGLRGAAASAGKKILHALRSSGASWMDESDMKKSALEWLQGADLKGRLQHYSEWPDWKILAEFWKAVPALTIDKTKYLREEIRQRDALLDRKDKEIAKLEDQDYLWHHKHKATEGRVDKIENMLEVMFTKFGIPLPDKPSVDKPQSAVDNDRLDRIEAMVSKLLPADDQPKGLIERVTSLQLKEEKTDNGDGAGEQG